MGCLYAFIQYLVGFILSVFFRTIECVGLENVPEDGKACIFVANHPNGLIDPAVVFSTAGRVRPLRQMAKAPLLRLPVFGALLRALDTIPVYRRQDSGGKVQDNSKAFQKVNEALANGSAIGIFPEGISHDAPELAHLKSGVAHMSLGAAAEGIEVNICPVGMTYIVKHGFRSRVLVAYGRSFPVPVELVQEYKEGENGSDQQKDTAHKLLDMIEEHMKSVTINSPDWETLRLAHTARRLFNKSEAQQTPEKWLYQNRRFAETYEEIKDDPEVEVLRNDVKEYQIGLDNLGVRDFHVTHLGASLGCCGVTLSWFRVLTAWLIYIVILLPLAIPGFILSLPIAVPAACVAYSASKKGGKDIIATWKVIVATILSPLYYIALVLVFGLVIEWYWALVSLVAIPLLVYSTVKILELEYGLVSVMYALHYRERMHELRATREQLHKRIRACVAKYDEEGDWNDEQVGEDVGIEIEKQGEEAGPDGEVKVDTNPRSGSGAHPIIFERESSMNRV